MSGGVLAALRAHTQDVHHRIDRHVDILRGEVTRDEYRRLLELLWGFHAPVEAWLTRSGAARLLPDWPSRRKVRWLADDLRALGISSEARSALPHVPGWWIEPTVPAVAGVLYVVEGSTLGGRVIARHVRHVVGDVPVTFLSAYGDQTGRRWRDLRTMLDTFDRDVAAVVAGARGAFDTFERWAMVGAAS